MYATGVIKDTEASQVSSRTQPVRSGSNLVGFFSKDSPMKQIDISTTKYPNTFTLIDDADYDWLSGYDWHVTNHKKNWYVQTNIKANGKKTILRMHRLIMNAQEGEEVDHRNGNGLHNYRSNLRMCNHSQNAQNKKPLKGYTSRYKGVFLPKKSKRWVAQIMKDYKNIHIGTFQSEIEAAKTYDRAAIKLFGEFARPNFPIINN